MAINSQTLVGQGPQQTTKHNCLRGKKDVYRHNFNFQVELDMQYALFIFAFPNEKV